MKDAAPDDEDTMTMMMTAAITIMKELAKLHSSNLPESKTVYIFCYGKQPGPHSPDQMQTGPAEAAYVLPCPVAHLSSVSAVVKQPPCLSKYSKIICKHNIPTVHQSPYVQ